MNYQIPGRNKGIASLILGLVALFLELLYFCFIGSYVTFPTICIIAALVCGIVGIVTGVMARKEMPVGTTGMATAGMVCSIIATVMAAFIVVACVACVGCVGCIGCTAAMNA